MKNIIILLIIIFLIDRKAWQLWPLAVFVLWGEEIVGLENTCVFGLAYFL